MKVISSLFFLLLTLSLSQKANAINLEFFQFVQNPGFNQTQNALKSGGHYQTYPWILTSSLSYVSNPLTIKQNNERIGSVLDSMTTFQIGGAYRLADSLQLGMNTSLGQQYGNEYNGIFAGDTNIDIIWRLFDGKTHALALQPRLTLPTGNGDYTSNSPHAGTYFGLNFESAFNWFQTAFNLGYSNAPGAILLNQPINTTSEFDLDLQEAIRIGFGALFPISGPWSLNVETYRYQQLKGDQHPNEIYSGLRYEPTPGLFAFGGLSTGGLIDKSSNDYRVSLGLKFAPYTEKKPDPEVIKKVEDKQSLRKKYLEREKELYGNIQLATNVYFANDSTLIVKTYQKLLEDLKKKFSTKDHYILEGYASERGETEYNYLLSQNRAQVVADYLIKLGVDQNKIKQVAYGEARAIEDIDEALNRKVMIRIYRK
jgi:outer membrane protein OmpA-like peptidoglycan-associated protein